MANLKEIRNRISSVTSTMKITSAMKMVSAAKLKKAEDAILLDNTHNSLEETINIVKNIIFSKLPNFI